MAVPQPQDGLTGLAEVTPMSAAGVMANEKHQSFYGFMTGAPYELAIVEFDDEGRCYDRGQMRGIADRFDALRQQEVDVIVLVFVHGWKHNARSDDDNLSQFRTLLAQTVAYEKAIKGDQADARTVLGIFVGWRGLSEFGLGDAVADLTFWNRQAAGQRVAVGSIRELFGRIRHYRNHRRDAKGAPLFAIAGHSFGGMIVFSALAQSLIEAASVSDGHVVPGFADLVLLVNPAIEAARYLPIYDLLTAPGVRPRTTKQLPLFICAQAENDQPVGTFFPLGNTSHRIEQATIGDLEKRCVTHAIGFIDEFKTHSISGPTGTDPFVLAPGDVHQENPFWVVHATKEVIDGHGGIWQEPFQDFLASIVFQHIQITAPPDARIAHAATGSLAAYARTIGPILKKPGS